MAKITREEVMAAFFPDGVPKHLLRKPASKPAPKPAAQRAEERWTQKPTEVVIRDEAAHNEAVIKRLRAEREAKRAWYQTLIDRVWQNQLDYQASLVELGRPSFHRGPGDPDW
jgi:hypothetical protein